MRRRYDFAQLEAMVLHRVGPRMVRVRTRGFGVQEKQLGKVRIIAEQFDVTKRTVQRWRRFGLSERQADLLAVQEGLHPLSVWPEWGCPTPEQPFDVGSGETSGAGVREHPAPEPEPTQEVRAVADLSHTRRRAEHGAV